MCIITLESAVSHIHYILENGKLYMGDMELKQQEKYNIDLVYIQDASQLSSGYNTSYGTICPNCGAPITKLGDKHCDYCSMAVHRKLVRMFGQ